MKRMAIDLKGLWLNFKTLLLTILVIATSIYGFITWLPTGGESFKLVEKCFSWFIKSVIQSIVNVFELEIEAKRG